MKEVKAKVVCPYYPLASEECRLALRSIGYDSFKIIGRKGSHTADVYFFGSDEDRFKEELLDNVLIGQFRKFYFSNSYSSLGWKELYYSVGYSKIK